MRINKLKTQFDEQGKVIVVREMSKNCPEINNNNSPEDIYKMLCSVFEMDKQTEEYVYLLCYNTKMNLVGIFEVSHGSVDYSVVEPREIFQKALLCNAKKIILAHNHPTGDCTPSKQDLEVTVRLKKCGELIGIELLDHIIIGDNYVSIKSKGGV